MADPMTGKNKTILILVILLAIIGSTLFPFLWNHAYYHIYAITWVLNFWFIYRITNRHVISQIGLWFTLNNLVDELFFDPTKIGINEYLFAIIIVFIILKRKKNAIKTTR